MNRCNETKNQADVSAIAFVLPQYHPIPENDLWWGKGFTEWTNVSKAKPLFREHYQPHLPADLGFYDLRLQEARESQSALAREHCVRGFCYYHYWFGGKRLLERPVNEILRTGKPDFPFCLCWANETWSRRWDGSESEVLMQQEYSAEDDVRHIQSLLPTFADHRYIKVGGRPLFLVYRLSQLPSPKDTSMRWRDAADKAGLPGLYLCSVESHSERSDPRLSGFDAAVYFAPRYGTWEPRQWRERWWQMRRLRTLPRAYRENWIVDYEDMVDRALAEPKPSFPRFPGVCVGFDSSPRRKTSALILKNSNPSAYGRWLDAACREAASNSALPPFVFINAWNEWAEGNHLEPCQKWGRQFLQATQNVLARYSS